jgi:hypothetical protein
LLAEALLQIRLEDILSGSLLTNIGSPQGFGASPVFFVLLLNKALFTLKMRCTTSHEGEIGLPENVEYADDTDFISQSLAHLQKKLLIAKEVSKNTS